VKYLTVKKCFYIGMLNRLSDIILKIISGDFVCAGGKFYSRETVVFCDGWGLGGGGEGDHMKLNHNMTLPCTDVFNSDAFSCKELNSENCYSQKMKERMLLNNRA